MPTRDLMHETVKRALIKDNWTITADPYIIEYEGLTLPRCAPPVPGSRSRGPRSDLGHHAAQPLGQAAAAWGDGRTTQARRG